MIDRQRLVRRHNPEHQSVETDTPSSVGNGEIAFTVDVTGLQPFPHHYQDATPLGTMSHWGWRSFPLPDGRSPEEFGWTDFNTYGRPVPYPYVGATRWFGVESAYWPLDPLKEQFAQGAHGVAADPERTCDAALRDPLRERPHDGRPGLRR